MIARVGSSGFLPRSDRRKTLRGMLWNDPKRTLPMASFSKPEPRRLSPDRRTDDGGSYDDARGGEYVPWLLERIAASLRCLQSDGSLFVHVDPRESHYVKVALDPLLGRASFQNEIVWAYDYGARSPRAPTA